VVWNDELGVIARMLLFGHEFMKWRKVSRGITMRSLEGRTDPPGAVGHGTNDEVVPGLEDFKFPEVARR
jgi:hypothetical protein